LLLVIYRNNSFVADCVIFIIANDKIKEILQANEPALRVDNMDGEIITLGGSNPLVGTQSKLLYFRRGFERLFVTL